MPNFEYRVDDEPQTTASHVLTPIQIMQLAGIDSATHYLVQLQGQASGEHQISYQNTPSVEVHMHQGLRFISISTGPTPVS